MEHPIGMIDLRRADDGTIVVHRADPIIALNLELLQQLMQSGETMTVDRGDLVFAGQVRYRPLEWSTFDEGLVCWKVAPESCRCTP